MIICVSLRRSALWQSSRVTGKLEKAPESSRSRRRCRFWGGSWSRFGSRLRFEWCLEDGRAFSHLEVGDGIEFVRGEDKKPGGRAGNVERPEQEINSAPERVADRMAGYHPGFFFQGQRRSHLLFRRLSEDGHSDESSSYGATRREQERETQHAFHGIPFQMFRPPSAGLWT